MVPAIARSMSASAITMAALLPPSSNEQRFRAGAALAMMTRPVALSPVNVIRSTPGCSVSRSPASPGPKPCTTLNTPGGMPASANAWASSAAVSGLCSAGLSTTVLPNASAGAIFQVSSISGKFHGEMHADTPTGSRSVYVITLSHGLA